MPPATVPLKPPGVFIDSGGFIALHVTTDHHHDAAVLCKDGTLQYSRLYTSPNVISETIAHIQRDRLLDQHSLDDLVADLLTEGWIEILTMDAEATAKALRLIRDTTYPRFSFVDASNIVLMEREHLETIFSFDGFYEGVAIQHQFTRKYLRRIP